MADMKMSDQERAEASEIEPYEEPSYPMGLRIHLTERELEKLGIARPKAGETVQIVASAKVADEGARTEEDEDEIHEHCCLQITEMTVTPDKKTAAGIYDGKGARRG